MKQINQDLKRKLKFNTGDTILTLLFFASIGLTVWAIGIYRLTVIDLKYLFAAAAFGTIIAFAIILFRLKSTYTIFWSFIISIAIGGVFFYFGLLYLNQVFADKETLTDDFQIVETGNLGRGGKSNCFQPYAIIDFNGTKKQLVFYCEYEKTIKNYSKVTVTFSKGLFGFNVIKSKTLP